VYEEEEARGADASISEAIPGMDESSFESSLFYEIGPHAGTP
jgi:hypothetical protein